MNYCQHTNNSKFKKKKTFNLIWRNSALEPYFSILLGHYWYINVLSIPSKIANTSIFQIQWPLAQRNVSFLMSLLLNLSDILEIVTVKLHRRTTHKKIFAINFQTRPTCRKSNILFVLFGPVLFGSCGAVYSVVNSPLPSLHRCKKKL